MKRTRDVGFFECPICGRKPYIDTYDVTVAWAFCKGYGFHRHKKVYAIVQYEPPSNLLKRLAQEWNQLGFTQARFLFHAYGKRFNEDAKDTNVPTNAEDGGKQDVEAT